LEPTIDRRIRQLRANLPAAGVEALLVLVAENRRYLSGFTGEDTQFDESAGALIITSDQLLLATDSRYELQARREAPDYEVICYKEGLAKQLPAIVGRLNITRLGFESVRLTVQQHAKIQEELHRAGNSTRLQPVEDLVETLRMVKDETEVEKTRSALRLAESVFTACRPAVRPGTTEKELAWLMEKKMREAGAEALSFATIVAAGPNSALPHAVPGDRAIQPGEPILFDWGARLDGYCSDISRTVILGRPDSRFQKVFQTVLDAQRFAIDAIRPGAGSRAVDKIARDHIERKGYGHLFGHGLGHGTGLAIHEAPRLSPLKEFRLEAGMVSTVEPGIYIPDWGGVRLENMIVVREDGAEVLNELDPGHWRI
jgi:Xaa-Pro aminopeptidase